MVEKATKLNTTCHNIQEDHQRKNAQNYAKFISINQAYKQVMTKKIKNETITFVI
jgi:hypothetical protein